MKGNGQAPMADVDFPRLQREQLKWTKIQVASQGHRMRVHMPNVDTEENPFCVERHLRDLIETHELNKVRCSAFLAPHTLG